MKVERIEDCWGECAEYASWRYKSHGEWLDNREKSPWLGKVTLGSSDAPIVMGASSFKDARTLWLEKHGDIPREFTGNAETRRGQRCEPLIRELFAAEHESEYDVLDGTGVVFYSKPYPWMSASLDAILRRKDSGELGILEIKDCRYSAKWRDGMPTMYYIQCLHQLLVTGWSFCLLHARLICQTSVIEREYLIGRDGYEAVDMARLIRGEREFMDALTAGAVPNYCIPNI